MATFSTEAQKLIWNINSDLKGLYNDAKEWFNSALGTINAYGEGMLNGDVVGINVDQIPQMQAAITQYVEAVSNHLQKVNTSVDTNAAFKGEYAEGVRAVVQAICNACDAIISHLKKFNKKLDEVREKYLEKDTTMASDLRAQAGELESSFVKYTE